MSTKTRASTRLASQPDSTLHPGLCDAPRTKRTSAQVAADKALVANKKAQEDEEDELLEKEVAEREGTQKAATKKSQRNAARPPASAKSGEGKVTKPRPVPRTIGKKKAPAQPEDDIHPTDVVESEGAPVKSGSGKVKPLPVSRTKGKKAPAPEDQPEDDIRPEDAVESEPRDGSKVPKVKGGKSAVPKPRGRPKKSTESLAAAKEGVEEMDIAPEAMDVNNPVDADVEMGDLMNIDEPDMVVDRPKSKSRAKLMEMEDSSTNIIPDRPKGKNRAESIEVDERAESMEVEESPERQPRKTSHVQVTPEESSSSDEGEGARNPLVSDARPN